MRKAERSLAHVIGAYAEHRQHQHGRRGGSDRSLVSYGAWIKLVHMLRLMGTRFLTIRKNDCKYGNEKNKNEFCSVRLKSEILM